MTREEIRAVIVGLDRLGTDECLCGDDRAIVRNALTLLRWMADGGDSNPDDIVFGVFADLDRERKAVAGGP